VYLVFTVLYVRVNLAKVQVPNNCYI